MMTWSHEVTEIASPRVTPPGRNDSESGISGGLSAVTGSGRRKPLRGARFGANPSNCKASWGGAGSRMAGNLVQGAVFTVMVVRAGMLRDPAFEPELAEQIRRSPRFFLNAPVVLDLKEAAEFTQEAEVAEAREILRRHTLTLIGVQNATPEQLQAAVGAGLASFAPNAPQPSRRSPRESAPSAAPIAAAMTKARLVTQPVRSGTQ